MPKPKPRRTLYPKLKKALQELDPSWSGEIPELPKPISLPEEGRKRLRAVLSRADDPDEAYGRMAAAALRMFYMISMKWGLSEEDQKAILGVDEDLSIEALVDRGATSLDMEAMECFSHILGIYRALNTLFPTDSQADAWIKKPNYAPLFIGRTALQMMREGIVGLRAVRAYLEAEAPSSHPHRRSKGLDMGPWDQGLSPKGGGEP
ncbi:MAG: MbcA/ParS/Xre antitoxin family protein [Geothrix sp.]|nr:MbcA/ParS/Xre antitoxin family protein [Geothrix sp.]